MDGEPTAKGRPALSLCVSRDVPSTMSVAQLKQLAAKLLPLLSDAPANARKLALFACVPAGTDGNADAARVEQLEVTHKFHTHTFIRAEVIPQVRARGTNEKANILPGPAQISERLRRVDWQRGRAAVDPSCIFGLLVVQQSPRTSFFVGE